MGKKTGNMPDFIIIGAMKCATTTLHDQLDMHDSFFMTNPKEPNYFSDDGVFTKGFRWYESLFEGAMPGQLRGESSTHYTKFPLYPETLARMKSCCPKVKLIYIMRHPVDRLVSHYIHEWTQGVVSCDIDKAIDRYPELIEYGRYNMQIDQYLKSYDCSALLPLFSERLLEHPLRELQTVFDFLNVNEAPIWYPEIKKNVSAERLRVSAWRDTIVNNNVLRFLRRRFVPKNIRRVVRDFWTMGSKPELSAEVLKKVEDIFNEDLQLLGQKLDLTLDCENYKQKIVHQKKIEWSR